MSMTLCWFGVDASCSPNFSISLY